MVLELNFSREDQAALVPEALRARVHTVLMSTEARLGREVSATAFMRAGNSSPLLLCLNWLRRLH